MGTIRPPVQTDFCRLLLLLIPAVLTSAIEPATESLCREYSGVLQTACNYGWLIPLSSKGTSATFRVQIERDFNLALVQNPPTPWNIKYAIDFGTYYNSRGNIGSARLKTGYASYTNQAVLNANSSVTLWVSWSNGVIATGTGSIVGQSTLMSYTDRSPPRLYYLLIGGCNVPGTATVSYCYGSIYDQRFPVDLPTNSTISSTMSDCGRTCEEDPQCKGYALARGAPLVGNITCNIFYSISAFKYNQLYVTYTYGNTKYPLI